MALLSRVELHRNRRPLVVIERGLVLFADIGQRAGLLITADLVMQPIFLPWGQKAHGQRFAGDLLDRPAK